MVVVIGKKTPRPTHLRGNPISAPYLFFVFDIFLVFFFIKPHKLLKYTNIYCPWFHYQPLNILAVSWFWGKNDQFCVYPLIEYCWGVFRHLQSPNRHIFVFNSVTQESPQCDTPYWRHIFGVVSFSHFKNYRMEVEKSPKMHSMIYFTDLTFLSYPKKHEYVWIRGLQ